MPTALARLFLKKHGIGGITFTDEGWFIRFKDGVLHLWVDDSGHIHEEVLRKER